MKYSVHIAAAVLATTSFASVFAQGPTWCGKYFMRNQTVVPPSGQFQLPASSKEPLVAFRCSPTFRPYLKADAKNVNFIVDTPIVYQHIQGASPISLSTSSSSSSGFGNDLGMLDVTINIGNRVFARQEVPVNTTGYEIAVDLSSLSTQKKGYNVICDATYQPEKSSKKSSASPRQHFSANTSLLYFPDTQGSVVKTDLRTGALLARPAGGNGGDFRPFIPQGFYISLDQQLAKNLSYIDQLKADGFNTIHPIPPYDDVTLFEQVLKRTEELGLYLVYDMRSNYKNLTAVARQVEAYSSLPNLLLWETAHEPDGNSDPFAAARNTYDLIYKMDGYHPVSIVLNCQDYNFAPYVEGADIILEDTYPIGINATFSPIWHTECTRDFGHCGCDNCQGSINDIKARIQSFKDRLNILGYDRTKTVWTTPQAIGSGAYWTTTPSAQQWAAMGLTSFSHGATGSISFQYPTKTIDAKGIAANITATIANTIQQFLVEPGFTHETFSVGNVDVGLWTNTTVYLLLVANLDSGQVHVPWHDIGLREMIDAIVQVQPAFSIGQSVDATGLNVGPGSIGIYTTTPPLE